ncbi:MAG: amidohydrolase [Pyrinomonadaceae bacterium]
MKSVAATLFILFFLLSVDGQTSADLILINANIRTLDERVPRAEALAVRDGRIIAVGKTNDIRKLAGDKTRVVVGGGKLVIPGFNDAHVHLTGIGNKFSHLDLRDARDSREVVDRITFFSSILPKGRWILGGGLNLAPQHLGQNLPTLEQLDAVSADNPLLIYFAGHKSALVNSVALKLAKITTTDSVISGATGVRVRQQVPLDHERNWPEVVETASNYAALLGVTSVQDVHSDDLAELLNTLVELGRLKTRVYDCVGIQHRQKAIAAGLKSAMGNAFVRGGCVKGLAEGTSDEIDELRTSILESDRAGLQVMIHAIGTRSNANVLDAFEKVIDKNGRRDRRFRIEHAARMKASDIARLSRFGIIASMQPHLFGAGSDDFRAVIDSGAMLAFGSDASITDFNPLLGIHAAVNSDSRSITVEEAVKAYTLGSAFAEFQEKDKGTLAVGKLADFVILSDDIFTIEKHRLEKTNVVMTVVGGKVAFERK